MTEQVQGERKLAKASFMQMSGGSVTMGDMWNTSPVTVDKLEFADHDKWHKIVRDCRFYYKHDSLTWTVINKMVDFAINDIIVHTDNPRISQVEKSIYDALNSDLIDFLKKAAVEYLITGLVVPEISFSNLTKVMLRDKGIKRLDTLWYPTDMWIRDSGSIEIKSPLFSSRESYFVLLSDEVINFIKNGGDYGDGKKDVELYRKIAKMYPELVAAVMAGAQKILLENPLVVKGRTTPDCQYPIPYIFAALESLKHKRNLRRVDYSIAARTISAILHVTVGDKDFPLTEEQDNVLQDLEEKFKWRESLNENTIDRVFALFTNHTVAIKWIFPEIQVLLDDKKYTSVNQDIVVALGFPRILITGETERSFSSDPQIATLSPLQTMENIRKSLLPIVQRIYYTMREKNDVVTSIPEIKFKPINLMSLQLFFTGLKELYTSGNISRAAYDEAYGYDFKTEANKRSEEKEIMDELDIDEFAPVPHSNAPGAPGAGGKAVAPKKKAGRPSKDSIGAK